MPHFLSSSALIPCVPEIQGARNIQRNRWACNNSGHMGQAEPVTWQLSHWNSILKHTKWLIHWHLWCILIFLSYF